MKFFLIGLGFFVLISATVIDSEMNHKKSVQSESSTGIEFRKMTLAEAKAEAAKTGKLIFIDAYTSWCGPCKLLAKNTFTNEEVGQKFNDKFICLHFEMETDADAPELNRTYSITAYPTLLFIDANGKLVKRVLGYRDAPTLLKDVAELVN